jgi:hypothetical protein
MDEGDRDTLLRMAAFEHVRRLGEVHDHPTATELQPGFVFEGAKIPLVNPQSGLWRRTHQNGGPLASGPSIGLVLRHTNYCCGLAAIGLGDL